MIIYSRLMQITHLVLHFAMCFIKHTLKKNSPGSLQCQMGDRWQGRAGGSRKHGLAVGLDSGAVILCMLLKRYLTERVTETNTKV